MTIDEPLPEDLLRELCEGQAKELSALRSMASAMATVKPPVIEVKVPPAPTQPAPKVTVTHAKAWNFEITERDLDGRIKSFTATPVS